jgi:hypothetical protein
MENNINIEDIFKGLLTGFFASYLIILGMRPAAIYPDNILDIIDNPWIFLILFIINYYVLYWDITVGLLLFLTLIALILDIIIFTDGDFLTDNINILNDNLYNIGGSNERNERNGSNGSNEHTGIKKASDVTLSSALTDKSYKDINDIILEKLLYYNQLYVNSDNIKSSNAFL